ncbi:MAG: hypothetical protein ACTHOK_00465, partial [Nocardioidaceae bacterium]
MFAIAPAQAAVPARGSTAPASILGLPSLPTLPVLSSIYPQIQGLGSITGSYTGGSYSCTNGSLETGVFNCIDALPTALLGGSLTATPLSGYEFQSWTNCPSGDSNPTCNLGALGGLLTTAPLASFVKILDGGTGGTGGTGGATDTLKTLLASAPGTTTGPDVSFLLGTNPADAAATFTCTLTGQGQTGTSTPCGPSVSYTNLADGLYTFTALAKTSKLTGTPVSYTFTVASDTPLAPETTVTGGPKNNGWLLGTATTFRLSSNQPGVSYSCTLDGVAHAGCADPAVLNKLGSRTHVFQAAAANALGVADASPAMRVFTVPVNNTKLKASKGWAKRKHTGHFLNTWSQTKRKGATLKVRSSAIRSVALVVTKGRGNGVVNVYLGKKLLKKVSLQANRTVGKRVVPIKKFSSKKRGTITVKVVSR